MLFIYLFLYRLYPPLYLPPYSFQPFLGFSPTLLLATVFWIFRSNRSVPIPCSILSHGVPRLPNPLPVPGMCFWRFVLSSPRLSKNHNIPNIPSYSLYILRLFVPLPVHSKLPYHTPCASWDALSYSLCFLRLPGLLPVLSKILPRSLRQLNLPAAPLPVLPKHPCLTTCAFQALLIHSCAF